MSKTIAFFDFDGTITTRDTMLEFIIFCKGRFSFFLGMILLSPWLVLMKLKLLSKKKAKERMLIYFFRNEDVNRFNEDCNQFIKNKLPGLINPEAIKKIKEHESKGHEVVVVSAAISNWMEAWCISNNLKCISTKLQILNNKVTGKLDGENCNNEEKVNKILKEYDLKNYEEIFCYGDTKGDKPMLQLATHAYYKRF